MAYDPMTYNPYAHIDGSGYASSSVNGIRYIESIDEARKIASQQPPNSLSTPMFLRSDDVFFIGSTDEYRVPTLTMYRYHEEEIPGAKKQESDYVTKADFDAFTARIMEAINGQLDSQETTQPKEQQE